jgi:p-hydroxybenzoate 3-monooxygenase
VDVTVGIVGAGPAGLVLGHLLQRAGIPFVLLERHDRAALAQHTKGGQIDNRTVEVLRRVGIADTALQFDVANHHCEFRTPEESVLLDFAALTGGRPHYVYPQHLLVDRLCTTLETTGADMRFAHTVHDVRQEPGGVVLKGLAPDGTAFRLHCEMAIGCEGSHSAVAAAMTGTRVSAQDLPVRWLGVIGAAPPLRPHTIYAAHPGGFAGQMRRGPDQTRYYLEVSAEDALTDWPEARIRSELGERLVAPGQLDAVSFGDPTFFDLRVRVRAPMQQGRLFLAGDAAHLITPAGGKGMNLAIQDAVELAHGLIDAFGADRDERRLKRYSETRLPAIWRTQAFSNWFLRILLASLRDGSEPDGALPGGFAHGLRQGWVHALQQDQFLARWFAHAYAGVDPLL